jgi:DNA polymerase III delta prime subunit
MGPKWIGKWRCVLDIASSIPPNDVLVVDGTIDGARSAHRFALSLPLIGHVKLILVDGRMGISEPAQDAYLKICEDTPDAVSIIIVIEDVGKLCPALVSRLDVIRWGPASDSEVQEYVNIYSLDVDDFCLSICNGRIDLIETISKNKNELHSLHEAIKDLIDEKPDITSIPEILTEWQKLDGNMKGSIVLTCENAIRSSSLTRGFICASTFIDAIYNYSSINAEIHWWRAYMMM